MRLVSRLSFSEFLRVLLSLNTYIRVMGPSAGSKTTFEWMCTVTEIRKSKSVTLSFFDFICTAVASVILTSVRIFYLERGTCSSPHAESRPAFSSPHAESRPVTSYRVECSTNHPGRCDLTGQNLNQVRFPMLKLNKIIHFVLLDKNNLPHVPKDTFDFQRKIMYHDSKVWLTRPDTVPLVSKLMKYMKLVEAPSGSNNLSSLR